MSLSTISLCMIVKNEEEVLYRCLESVKEICDEIIIVDTGSTDKTKELASRFTGKIFDFQWIDDFSAARNFAFSKATMNYILWLDADDLLRKEDREKLMLLKHELNGSVDAVSMLYHIAFDEYDKPAFSYRRNRLVKRENNFKWIGQVHEYLEVWGNILQADIAIIHRKKEKTHIISNRNLKIYEKRIERGETFTPRDLFYYANELKDHTQYQKAVDYYVQFLATKQGWEEDEIRACINMAECHRHLNNVEEELESLFMSFNYDVPRPEVSCRIGDIYQNRGLFQKAIKWYRLALEIKEEDHPGFKIEAYSTWYPNLQLCKCYWNIGEVDLSFRHHKQTKNYRPDDVRVKYNDDFFNRYFENHVHGD